MQNHEMLLFPVLIVWILLFWMQTHKRKLYMTTKFVSNLIQICITTSTAADLDQILPWMYYHKVIGVTAFFLFVEGKAASPNVTRVLESIPVSRI